MFGIVAMTPTGSPRRFLRSSKEFAVGAALLVALVPWVARAGALELLGQDGPPSITFTSPTSFSSFRDLTGDACWYQVGPTNPEGGSLCGGYGFTALSGLPGTSQLGADFNPLLGTDARFSGTVEWTAVEGYPASPELIGTFTSGGVFSYTTNPSYATLFAELAAEFPAGSVDPITVTLEAAGASPFGFCPGQPQSFCIEHGEILTSAPAPPIGRNLPALLAVCIVLLGVKLLKRGQNRRRLGAGLT